jgi:hypothetical protein
MPAMDVVMIAEHGLLSMGRIWQEMQRAGITPDHITQAGVQLKALLCMLQYPE